MTVAFFGHRKLTDSESIRVSLQAVIKNLIEKGADEFLLGGYGEFDMLVANAVKAAQKDYPHIKSVLVLPYLDRKYPTGLYDETIYPPLENVPRLFSIAVRNKWMVDKADVIAAYVTHTWGGAADAVGYAKAKKKRIVLILQK